MATDLEVFTPRDVETIKAVLAPGVSDEELALFGRVCSLLDLSPFRDEVALVGRYSKDAGRKVYKHQVTVHGRRVLAQRTGELRGIGGPEWTGPRDEHGHHHWTDLWDSSEPPHAARVRVYRAGWAEPAIGTVPWREFAQRDREGRLVGLWPSMPAHMLGKVAEALALRRAFPEVITEAVEAEWDDVDTDRPVAEVGNTPSPPPAVTTTSAVPMMTAEQAAELGDLVEVLDMAGPDNRAARMAYISTELARDVGDTRTITAAEASRLIMAMREDLTKLHEHEAEEYANATPMEPDEVPYPAWTERDPATGEVPEP